MPKISATGMVWYRADSFDRVRAMMADANVLPETYEKFLYGALKGEEKLRRSGVTVVRVHLDEDDFPAYCAREGLNLDAHSRSNYAAHKAMQAISQGHRGGNA